MINLNNNGVKILPGYKIPFKTLKYTSSFWVNTKA